MNKILYNILLIIYRPTDLLILQKTDGEIEVEESEINRLRKKYEDQYYFVLNISRGNKEALYQLGKGQGYFSEMVQKLSFGMGEHVNLTTSGQDTIFMADYVFSRTFGLGTSTSLLFAFDKEKATDDTWVQFNLSEFGMGIGRQSFRFDKEDINDIPVIKYEFIN